MDTREAARDREQHPSPVTDLFRQITRPRSSDDYRHATPLARGGMAVLERVFDTRLHREIARKLLPMDARRRDLSSAERRRLRRFLDEAFVQSQLQHPAILPVHDLGIDERGWPFFTMPIVQGKHFGEILAEVHAGTDPAWTRERALQLLIDVSEAVSYAHGNGVVHRDLKPENLMVGVSGQVLLMDFGLACIQRPATDGAELASEFATLRQQLVGEPADAEVLTLEGDVVGTPAYMAPEQAAGNLRQVDQFSDQYALGAVLYQLLTATRPYGDRSTSTAREIVAAVRQRPPTPIHVLNPSVPAELCAICERAMQRDPSARYAQVAAFTADLRAFLEQRVVRAHATGWRARLRSWLRRNRWAAASTFAASAAVIGGVTAVLWVQSAQETDLRASAEAILAEQATSKDRLIELRHHIYVSDIGLVQRLRAGRRPRAEVRAILDRCDPTLRSWEWHYLASVEDPSAHTFQHGAAVNSLALSEDGRVLASTADDGFVKLWDARSGALRREIRVGGKVAAIALSTDSRVVACGADDSTVRLHDAVSGEPLAQSVKLEAQQMAACFSPDGTLLVTAGIDKKVHAWRVPGMERIGSYPTMGTHPQVLVHPSGDRVVVGSDDTIAVYDLATGSALFGPEQFPAGGYWHLALDARGTTLRAPGRTAQLELDLATGAHSLRALPAFPSGVRCLLAEGQRVALTEHGHVRLHDSASQTSPPGWQAHSSAIRCMTADRAGHWLFTGDSTGVIHQWNLAAKDLPSQRPPVERTYSIDGGVVDLALSADGGQLAVACGDGKLRLWQLDREDPPRTIDATAGSVAFLHTPQGPPQIVSLARDESRLWFHRSEDLAMLDTQTTPGWHGSVRVRASLDGRFVVLAPRAAWASQCGLVAIEPRAGGNWVHDIPVAAASLDIAIRQDGSQVATADIDGRLRVHDTTSWRKLLDIEIDSRPLRSVAWSPDGREIAVGRQSGIHILNASTGVVRAKLLGHKGWVQGLAWSADGARLFSLGGYSDDQLKVWDPHRNIEYLSLPLPDWGGGGYSIALSADDRVLAIGGARRAMIWRLP